MSESEQPNTPDPLPNCDDQTKKGLDYYQRLQAQLKTQLQEAVDSLTQSLPGASVDFPLGDAVASPAPQDLKAQLDPQARKDQEEKLAQQVQQAQQALEAHKVQTDQLEILALLGQLDRKGLREVKDRLVRLVRNKSRS